MPGFQGSPFLTPTCDNRPGRLRLLGLCAAAGCLLVLSGCYSEMMGPAPHELNVVSQQPGGSFRLGRVDRTVYTVHLFWGIWTPKKTNSWKTLETEVKGKAAAGAYDVKIETYMPWWHIFPAWWTGGIVDISAHTVTAETFAYAAATPPPATAPNATLPSATPTTPVPALTAPPPPGPTRDPTPTQKPPEPPIIQGDAGQPETPAPLPGRDPNRPNAPGPVVAP